MNQIVIYTIGHSNHSIDEFIALLKQHGIEVLVDIRRFPSSRPNRWLSNSCSSDTTVRRSHLPASDIRKALIGEAISRFLN